MTNEIQVIPENEIAVAFQTFTAKELFERVEKEARSVVFDLSNSKEQTALRSHVYKLRQSKTAFDNHGKALKDKYAEIPKKIDAERKLFKESIDNLIEELIAPLVAIEVAESQRKKDIESRITAIKIIPSLAAELDSKAIQDETQKLKLIQIDSSFQEYETQAKLAKYEAIDAMDILFIEATKAEEAEAEALRITNAEIEADRIKQEELEKQRQIERDEQIKRQATIDAENAVKAKQNELVRQKEEAERKAQEAQKQAELAIEREKQRVAEEQRQLAEAEAKRQANKAHQKRTCEKALDDLKSIVMADTTGLTLGEMMKDSDLKKIINAIHKGEVSNISINY